MSPTYKELHEGQSAFKLVYQSGHRGVWCDGNQHLSTADGWTKFDPNPEAYGVRPHGGCDCAYWAKFNEGKA